MTSKLFVAAFIALASTLAIVSRANDNPMLDVQYALAGAKVKDQFTEVGLQNRARVASNLQLVTDIDVLIFALNLEYLAANFWSCAATGRPLEGFAFTGLGPKPLGCMKANLSPEVQAIAEEVAFDESAHVLLLRAKLGKFAVPQPLINLNAGPKFILEASGVALEPFLDDDTFLATAFVVSDVEPTAYRGALPLLKVKIFQSVTAGLLGTESYHAGILRKALLDRKDNLINGVSVETIVQAISNRRDILDRDSNSDQGITINGMPNLVPTDANGLIFPRSPAQILALIYDGGLNLGGFFPFGLNARVRNQLQG